MHATGQNRCEAIYCQGWQVADNNGYLRNVYPTSPSIRLETPCQSGRAHQLLLRRAIEIQHSKVMRAGDANYIDNFAPIIDRC
jgi:isocitrate lyase